MPPGDLRFTGPQMEELRDAITAAFDQDSLKQLVRFRLEKDLFTMVREGPLNDVAFNLIQWAEREGEIAKLVRAVGEARPTNPKVRDFCTAHARWAFSPPAPE